MTQDANLLLLEVAKVYGSLGSYCDTGIVSTKFDPGTANESSHEKRFSTYFKRPNLFRFEWFEISEDGKPDNGNVVWCDGKNAYTKYSSEKTPNLETSLSLAIAGATGVSGGTAHTIAALLMEEISGNKLTDGHASSLDPEVVNGEECSHLLTDLTREHVFVAKKTSTVVRIDEDHVIGSGSTAAALKPLRFDSLIWFFRWLQARMHRDEDLHVISSTIYHGIKINCEIPDEVFSLAGAGQIS
jgi:outer membrane lipoprotein-sorting protein